jgi:cephalosporin hydroxylase
MIGAGPGVMALALKEGNSKVMLAVIDIATYEWCFKHLEHAGLNENVSYYQMDSARAAEEYSSVINLLIVDGDHTYEGVMRDLVAWMPKMSIGGYALLHDYDARKTIFENVEQYPGVKKTAHKYLKHQRDKYERVERVGTSLIVRRK